MNTIHVKKYEEPPFDRKEIFRYMGSPKPTPEVAAMTEECIAEARPRLSYKVCWREFDISRAKAGGAPIGETAFSSGSCLDLGFAVTYSKDLQKNLSGCCRILLFGATVGLELDRLIARYGRVSPAKALCFQAIGAERIESLCNAFNCEVDSKLRSEGFFTRPRFSPGYGDLAIDIQKDIFIALDCSRKIGLSLNESLLMSPSKSVTAIIGISAEPKKAKIRTDGTAMGRAILRQPATAWKPQAALPVPKQTAHSGGNK